MAVLGQRDQPTDAVEEYCYYLSQEIATQGISLELTRVAWAQIGWRKALERFRKSALETGNTDWFLFQYTALAWSQHGFSICALQVIRLLKSKGAQCAVVFHDAEGYCGSRLVDRLRRAVQNWTMRQAVRLADLAIFTIPPEIIPWAPPNAHNALFIPVGANLPAPERAWKWKQTNSVCRESFPTVAIFSLSDGAVRAEEVKIIAEAASYAAVRTGKLQIVVLGRNSEVGAKELKERLTGAPVEVTAHGLVAPEQVVHILANCDVMLFARGVLSTRRGSAIGGIACGLPVVAREGWETAAPITEAGVVLVPEGEKEGFGPALLRVLSNESYRSSLAERSKNAQKRYFSWDAIAAQYARALRTTALRNGHMDQGTEGSGATKSGAS